MDNILQISISVIQLLDWYRKSLYVNVAFIAAEVIKEEYVEAFHICCVRIL